MNYSSHTGKLGLDSLASRFLGLEMDKDWRLRASDWEAEQLSQRQTDYAADDGLVAGNILIAVLADHVAGSWLQQLAVSSWSLRRLVDVFTDLVSPFVDLRFSKKLSTVSGLRDKEKARSASPKENSNPYRSANSVRKSPLYHNCKLEAPDGQVHI